MCAPPRLTSTTQKPQTLFHCSACKSPLRGGEGGRGAGQYNDPALLKLTGLIHCLAKYEHVESTQANRNNEREKSQLPCPNSFFHFFLHPLSLYPTPFFISSSPPSSFFFFFLTKATEIGNRLTSVNKILGKWRRQTRTGFMLLTYCLYVTRSPTSVSQTRN